LAASPRNGRGTNEAPAVRRTGSSAFGPRRQNEDPFG
jgi:hypothetical protein